MMGCVMIVPSNVMRFFFLCGCCVSRFPIMIVDLICKIKFSTNQKIKKQNSKNNSNLNNPNLNTSNVEPIESLIDFDMPP